jgi:streptogramin lyase
MQQASLFDALSALQVATCRTAADAANNVNAHTPCMLLGKAPMGATCSKPSHIAATDSYPVLPGKQLPTSTQQAGKQAAC